MIVKDCLGREREPSYVWEDGSYNCPFCASAAKPEGCRNPACFARVEPAFPVERAKELMAAEEARKAETARRERDNEWRRQYNDEKEKARIEGLRALTEECIRNGYCVRCATKDYPFRAARMIKHRKECPR